MKIPLPIILMKEDGWFVAECPLLDISTQGKTEEETKENMEDLINEYLRDPDTPKPKAILQKIMSVSLTNIPIEFSKEVFDHGKTSSVGAT
jgi:predicted RNase H-like HicB family nuclease